MVTLTAEDSFGSSSSIAVTIMVNPIDEPPEIMVGGLAVSGLRSIEYAEKGTGMVATYTALGPDAASATWSLDGDDAGDFSISSGGVLTFNGTPDFESPADAGTDNVYMVTVEADDGTYMGSHDVTVTVTNVDEGGTVTLSSDDPQVGVELTATLDDPDGSVTDTTWQWASSDAMDGTYADITEATSASYTPVAGDVDMYLRATANYTDRHGSGKMAMEVTGSAVMAADVGNPLVNRYDVDNSGEIEKSEVITAINDYLYGEGDDAIGRNDVIEVINLYLFD